MAHQADLDRRDFVLAGVGVAAAAAAATRPLRGQTKPGPNSQVGYGFIGAGSRGQQLLGHLSKVTVGRPVAMCDVYRPNLDKGIQTVGGKPEPYYDYRELLARKDVDAVYIAVPLFKHFEVTKAALEAGKNVFCEKSLVFKPEEVHELRELVKKHPGQVLQTGLQRRYSRTYQVARQMIEKGMLGKLTHIQAQWHRNSDWRRPTKDKSLEEQFNWRLYKKYSGGLTAELASHQVDIADWMFGMTPESVIGVGGLDYYKDGRDIYDNIQLFFTYPKGQKLIYHAITTNAHMPFKGLPDVREVGEVIMGDQGTIHISLDKGTGHGMWFIEPNIARTDAKGGQAKENWTAGATVLEGAITKGFPILPISEFEMRDTDSFLSKEVKFAKRWLYNKGVLVPEETRDPVAVELEDFLLCVRDGRKPRADMEVGLNDSIAVILANLAMDEERKVKFSEIESMGKGQAAPGKPAAPAKRSTRASG